MPVVGPPLTYAGLAAADFNIAIAFAEMLAMDRLKDDADLFGPNVGAIMDVGNVSGRGTDSIRTQWVATGWDRPMAPVAETAAIPDTGIDVEEGDVSIGRFGLQIPASQLHQITDRSGKLNPAGLAASGVDSFRASRMNTLASVFPSFTDSIGTAASPASIDDLYEAAAVARTANWFRNGNTRMPILGAIRAQQINEIIESSRAEEGTFKERIDAQNLLSVAGREFELLGISVFQMNRVTDSGGTINGGLWVPGAIGHAIGSTENVWNDFGVAKPAGLPLIIDYKNDASEATLRWVFNAYYGVGILGDEGDDRGRVWESAL